jgi:outer membrane protein assembly factor BamB
MQHAFACPHCGAPLNFDAGAALVALKCAHCGMSTPVPAQFRPPAAAHNKLDDGAMRDVFKLIDANRLIDAVKLIRSKTGWELQESKDFVDALTSGHADLLAQLMTRAPAPQVKVYTVNAPKVAKAAASAGCAGTAITLLFVLMSIGIPLYFMWQGGIFTPLLNRVGVLAGDERARSAVSFSGLSFNKNAQLIESDAEKPIIVSSAMDIDASPSQPVIAYIDVLSNTVRWRVPAALSTQLFAAGDLILNSDKSQLIAYDEKTGAVRWQTLLSDAIAPSCRTCLQATSTHIFALSNDDTLQAFNRLDGRKTGSMRVSASAWGIGRTGDSIVIVDGNSEGVAAKVLDGALTQQREIEIGCGVLGSRRRISISSLAIRVDSENGMLYSLPYGDGACLVKHSLISGEREWITEVPGDNLGSTGVRLHLADTHVAVLSSETAQFVNAASGKASARISSGEDYAFTHLLDVQQDVALLAVYKTRGTRIPELQAFDTKTAEKLWTLPFGEGGIMGGASDDGDAVSFSGLIAKGDEEVAWAATATDKGVHVLRVTGKPEFQYSVETLGLRDGVSNGTKVHTLVTRSLLLAPRVLGWRGETVWMIPSEKFMHIDAGTGALLYSTP